MTEQEPEPREESDQLPEEAQPEAVPDDTDSSEPRRGDSNGEPSPREDADASAADDPQRQATGHPPNAG
jgi:hypothetical protein